MAQMSDDYTWLYIISSLTWLHATDEISHQKYTTLLSRLPTKYLLSRIQKPSCYCNTIQLILGGNAIWTQIKLYTRLFYRNIV